MNELKLLAVAGNPVLHSRSPDMFRAVFDALNMTNYHYLRFAASKPEDITQAMREVSIAGFNVTSPFKETVVPFLDSIDETVRRIGAVNTIVAEEGRLKGYNTDLAGVRDLFPANNIALKGKSVVVLGAGGAAKAAAAALVSAAADVVVVNRTFEKARAIAETFMCRAASMEELGKEIAGVDVLVSCLPTGKPVVPVDSLREGLIVLEANYSETTALMTEGLRNGCIMIDGREWLLHQGIAAFKLFTGLESVPVEMMRKSVYGKGVFARGSIALVGFMGSGKSVVGRHTAKKLKLPFFDVDSEIEKTNNVNIEEIFSRYGEDVFRKMEAHEIERLAAMPGRVISCGGGAVLNQHSMECLREHCIVIWLWAGIETILRRTSHNDGRPLLRVTDKRSEIERMLGLRKSCYAGASHLFMGTDDRSPEEIAERICHESGKFLAN